MRTIYQQGDPIYNPLTHEIIGYQTIPVVVPDTFWIQSGLVYSEDMSMVAKDGKNYYLDNITVVSDAEKMPTTDEWESTYGNWIATEYYEGKCAENPSGNKNNVRKRTFYNSSDIPKYVVEYHFDEQDRIIKQKSIAPNGEDKAESDEDLKEDENSPDNYQKPRYLLTITSTEAEPVFQPYYITFEEGTTVNILNIIQDLESSVEGYLVDYLEDGDGNMFTDNFVISNDIELNVHWIADDKTTEEEGGE